MHSLSLTSHFRQTSGDSAFEIRLRNAGDEPLTGFTLGISGPGRIGIGAHVDGAAIIDQLGTWCELAPPKGFVLAPGETWTIIAADLDFRPVHWTDGVTSAMVKLTGGAVHVVRTSRGTSDEGLPLRAEIVDLSPAAAPGPFALIPWPAAIDAQGLQTPPEGFALCGHAATEAGFADLTTHLFPGEALVRPVEEGGFPVTLTLAPGKAAEGYDLTISPGAAQVQASTPTGLLYGLISLAQMARGARRDSPAFTFPAQARIADAPHLAWRGCHWDVARRFYATAEVAQFLRIMAWNKLNRFHWHLSEDEAWRIEIDAYPELCKKGAWRGYGLDLPPLLGSGAERSGGYYSKAAVRSLIALGQNLGIEIVPEVDLPGHCYALLTAMPRLRDAQENGLYHSIQSFPNNCLNPALPEVEEVVQTILGELCDLFPAPWFHVGADEVPEDAWHSSPRAQAMLKAKGGEEMAVLQADLLRRLQAFLSSRGKITGAWQEAAAGGGIDKASCYLVGWKTVASNRELAAEGYDVVVSPAQAYYLDMALGPEWAEPGAHWAGHSSAEATYRFDPAAGWTAAEQSHLMGIQACIWSEPMTDRGAFQRLVFPRLSAIAETGWTPPGAKDWPRFAGAAHLMPSLYPLSSPPKA